MDNTPLPPNDYFDDEPLEPRRREPSDSEFGPLRRWLAFWLARLMLLFGLACLVEGIRTDYTTDSFVYPLFIARSYIFFPTYVSVGITDEVSLTWRLMVLGWFLGGIMFVWFSHEKLFALLTYIALPVLIIIGSFQMTGSGKVFWHSGVFLINDERHHQTAVYEEDQDALDVIWFSCNAVGLICVRVDDPRGQ